MSKIKTVPKKESERKESKLEPEMRQSTKPNSELLEYLDQNKEMEMLPSLMEEESKDKI